MVHAMPSQWSTSPLVATPHTSVDVTGASATTRRPFGSATSLHASPFQRHIRLKSPPTHASVGASEATHSRNGTVGAMGCDANVSPFQCTASPFCESTHTSVDDDP